ncbi:MAG: 50S ribosomal protein L10 [Deltaproteobacteria bacterium]
MLTKAVKREVAAELSERFKSNPSLLVVEYKGLSVKQMEGLRRKLKKAGADFKVIKNSLLKVASQNTALGKAVDLFEGATAVAICKGDPISVAKVFVDSLKDLPVLKLKGGVVEGNLVGFEQIKSISSLPSREVLIGQFLGLLASPMSNFLGTLQQLQCQLLYALEAVREQKENGESNNEDFAIKIQD